MEVLKQILLADGLQKLRDEAEGCPACIMSAILQLVPKGKRTEEDPWYEFNYKEYRDEWQSEKDAMGITIRY